MYNNNNNNIKLEEINSVVAIFHIKLRGNELTILIWSTFFKSDMQ